MHRKQMFRIIIGILAIMALTLILGSSAWAATTYKILHRFTGADGGWPRADLILDDAGNLYGTTLGGGAHDCGTVFKLTPNSDGTWSETVLHTFTGVDGCYVSAGLIFDAAGNLYGTASQGGAGAHNYGTVFKLTPNGDGSWTESVLHSFNGSDGMFPESTLIFDAAANLYGATSSGGSKSAYCPYGCGTVFKLTPNGDGSWTESVIHSFNGSEGNTPFPGLTFDAGGNLYGTTVSGGAFGSGTVFRLTPNLDGTWTESVLHSFCSRTNCADGGNPTGILIFDAAGNLYGTAFNGGAHNIGTVFMLTPNSDGTWTERVLHNFARHPASYPAAGLIFDLAGNLYGTTAMGSPVEGGTVFKMTPNSDGSWALSVLHVFMGKPARHPFAGLVMDKAGNLYGTTTDCAGGTNCANNGVVFEIIP